jgi:hypothetical protein
MVINTMKCFFIGLYRTLKNLDDLLLDGTTHTGHFYVVLGDSMKDQFGWSDLVCKRCGKLSRGNR